MKGLSKNVKKHAFYRFHYSVRQKIGDPGSISTQNMCPLISVVPKPPESAYGATVFCLPKICFSRYNYQTNFLLDYSVRQKTGDPGPTKLRTIFPHTSVLPFVGLRLPSPHPTPAFSATQKISCAPHPTNILCSTHTKYRVRHSQNIVCATPKISCAPLQQNIVCATPSNSLFRIVSFGTPIHRERPIHRDAHSSGTPNPS